MKGVRASYTVETALVMSVIIFMIFSVITYTVKLYEKVKTYSENCVEECAQGSVSSDAMRLERLLSAAGSSLLKEDK
ncbi:MAG: hypothetical protein K6G60_00820 [Lachnospiraceae bacterium]|nr:hypothetical protein [Lachnospiraceae bacterium]